MTTWPGLYRNGLTPWMLDVFASSEMELTVRSGDDSNYYTVWLDGGDGKKKITIPQAQHGDTLCYVRGVYTSTSQFNWQGFWAYVYDCGSDAVNYLDTDLATPWVRSGTSTIITLKSTATVGASVMALFVYETTQTLTGITFLNNYPCNYKCYGGPYPSEMSEPSISEGKYSAAVDSDITFVLACIEAKRTIDDDYCYSIAKVMINKLRHYDATTVLSYKDGINYTEESTNPGWYYAVGDPKPTFLVVENPTDSTDKVLKITSNASTYSIAGKLWDFTLASGNNFVMDFKGNADSELYKVEICNDSGAADTIDKRFYYVFRDQSTSWQLKSFPIQYFRSKKNVVYSDLESPSWGQYKGTTAITTYSDEELEIDLNTSAESYLKHYKCRRLTWDFTLCLPGDEYAGTYVTITNPDILSTSYSNVNFHLITQLTPPVFPILLRVIVRDVNSRQFYKDVTVASGAERITVNFADMAYYTGGSGSGALVHPIDQVFVEAKVLPVRGTIFIWDVKFGSHDLLPDYNISLWQLRLPTGSKIIHVDDIGFDKVLVDQYQGTPFFSYQWTGTWEDTWQGPTYTAYVMPAAYYLMGYTADALTQIDFIKDAQNEYYNWYNGTYGVAAGPVLPVHTRLRPENASYGDLDSWTWNSPNFDTHWAGYQYRAFMQAAHYYYLTGNSDAYTYCVNWINWIDAQTIEDPAYPAAPKGYKPPSYFKQWPTSAPLWTNDDYSPDYHGLIIQACIFLYWRSGNAKALTWYRRLLDDLITNRVAVNGSYVQTGTGLTYAFHQAEVGKAIGMLINGRYGGVVNYTLTATAGDITAFENLYDYFYNNRGSAKPCALSNDWLPLHQRETKTYGDNEKKWVVDDASLSEGIANCMIFALDYRRHDPTAYGKKWFNRLKEYLYNTTIGAITFDDATEEEILPVEQAARPADAIFHADSYYYYNSTATSEVSGLWHLNGVAVIVIADDSTYYDRTVSNGKIEIDVPARRILIGKKYTGMIKTSPRKDEESKKGQIRRVISLVANIYNSGKFKFGEGEDISNLDEVYFKDGDVWDLDNELQSGHVIDSGFPGRYNRTGQVTIVQDTAKPLLINAIIETGEYST